jgi:hypothetical protein
VTLGASERVTLKWLTDAEIAALDERERQYDELRLFHDERVAADHATAVEAVLAEFADLSDNEEFAALRETAFEATDLEALKTACFAVRGKSVTPRKPAATADSSLRMPIQAETDAVNHSRYGSLLERFGKK